MGKESAARRKLETTGRRAHLGSLVHKCLDVCEALYSELGERLDVRAEAGVLSDLEVTLIVGVEEVANLFLIDLGVRHLLKRL